MEKVSPGLQSERSFISSGLDSIFDFSKQRIGTHARLQDFPVEESELQKLWHERMSKQAGLPARAAYINIPFCRLHCLYCGFFKNYHERARTGSYVQALLRDIKMTAAYEYSSGMPLQAIYFGGGTPGVLTPEEITQVLTALKDNYPLAKDCEITFETSLSDLDDDQFAACMAGGVNRFSLGVQTFNTKIRQSLGRPDDETRLRSRLAELCQSQTQAAIVIDLIYGLPGQTLPMWQYDLDVALDLELHGFDTYALNILPQSQLAKLLESGKLPPVASKNGQSDFFAQAVQKLEKAGMRRLSICHWGRFDLRERNLYNSLSKGPAGKIPFGSGAGGSLDGWRVRLVNDAEDYERRIEAGQKPVAFMSRPGQCYLLVAKVKAAMDMGFIPVELFTEKIKQQIDEYLSAWERKGLINRARGIYELTLLGQFWHGELTQLFLDFVQQKLAEEKPL